MTNFQEISCMLCLQTVQTITVKGFEVIDNANRDILDVLLLKLEFDSESKEVICNTCRRKLSAALEFKTKCLNTNNIIMSYVDRETMLQLDIREVYLKEKRSELVNISCSQKICRLCMQPVKSEFMCIHEEELETIQKLAPEVNVTIVKDPIVCMPCFDSLCTHNSFLKNCLEIQEKIRCILNRTATECQIDTLPSDLFVKSEYLDEEMSIKVESVDIKSEDEERSDTLLQGSDIGPFMKNNCKDAEENGPENKCNTKTEHEAQVLYKSDICIYQTASKSCLAASCARHENNSEVHKCESCEYETENKKLLQRHRLSHKDPSEIRTHQCESCNYETKYRSNFVRRQVKHKARLYKCNFCDFETEWKTRFTSHYIQHKHANNDECVDKTKDNTLPCKDTSQPLIYKCDGCIYESKDKILFAEHQLIHKDPSQVQLHRCSDCNYETKYRSYIKRHKLKHKDPSQVQMYRCNDCDYETKYSSSNVQV
ncbi:zinc finger autosomal protein-like [Anoplophora glabripennis]|uniref:zinc finger autosomal protein-like n=1 Tax=Anoplophora glabripennis TaxID=217634 RepID=UPI0008755450|nr:zinc finger autosomal protein-like [Anoplophora glabripennis]